MKFGFQSLQIKFYWNTPTLIHVCVVCGCFQDTRAELNSCGRLCGLWDWKYLLSGSSRKFSNPSSSLLIWPLVVLLLPVIPLMSWNFHFQEVECWTTELSLYECYDVPLNQSRDDKVKLIYFLCYMYFLVYYLFCLNFVPPFQGPVPLKYNFLIVFVHVLLG